MPENNVDPFAGMEEVKSNSIQWGKVNDWIKGTLVDNTRSKPNKYNPTEIQKIFEIKVHGGSFHRINEDKTVQEDPTVLEPGSYWNVFLKPGLYQQMRHAKIGQVIGFRFKETTPSATKGNSPAKIIQPILGSMDPDYQGESSTTVDAGPSLD